jgi:hypothetical protein
MAIMGLVIGAIALTAFAPPSSQAQLETIASRLQCAVDWAQWNRQPVLVTLKNNRLVFASNVALSNEDWAQPMLLTEPLQATGEQVARLQASGLNAPAAFKFVDAQGEISVAWDARNRFTISR